MPHTVGIVGGGQLAQMMAQAAVSLAVDVVVLAESAEEPAARAGARVVQGDPDDLEALRALAAVSDVVTLDHELVDPAALAELIADGTPVRPGPEVLRFANKAIQREALSAAGFPLPRFALATTADELDEAIAEVGGPGGVVAKPATGGYDGRGVFVIANADELPHEAAPSPSRPVVVEERLALDGELAVLVARSPAGEATCYPVVHTIQRDGICHETTAPAPIDDELAAAAVELGLAIASEVRAVGILAVELFVCGGDLLVNELAPRPHNSGHWTIEGSATSQFENHLRAVLGLPLGSTSLRAPAVATVNVLGARDGSDPRDRLAAGLAVADTHLHLYAKQARPGRKLGHVTATGPDPSAALGRAWASVSALTGARAPDDLADGAGSLRP